MRRFIKYFQFVMQHKIAVFKIGLELKVPLHLLLLHDIGKFHPKEFIPYAYAFYDGNGKSRYKPDTSYFDLAWLRHQKTNKHHWQYWVTLDENTAPYGLPIPARFVKEAAADLIAFGKLVPQALPPLDYITKNEDRIVMDRFARRRLTNILIEWENNHPEGEL